MIEVRPLSAEEYEIVINGKTKTTHHVSLHEEDRVRLAGKTISAEMLIEESFHFLLEREPNTSILRTFDLPIISKYFPEYEREIRKRLAPTNR